ncbi:MAG TPA: DNA helicase UvrD, partial [Desulfurobacteriaceae bacterium]|nr:DNA helicase UvrD [Desulfurobacteriaceae bacterium]
MIEFLKDLNKEQKEAVKYFETPLLVLAGAGSGKTRVITYKIAYATKYLGFDPSRILAITFTNKAARELKERIAYLLGKETPIWASTFHSFCVKILRRHISALGYSRYFEIYDENDSKRLLEKVIKELNLDKDKYSPSYLRNIFSKIKNESISYEDLEDKLKEAFNLYNKLLKEK